jgi:MFS family permease
LRRNRDFVRLWTGGAISSLGSSITALAFPLLALSLASSAAAAGLLGLVGLAVGAVMRLPAGVMVDRAPLRWLLIGSDLIRAAVTLAAAIGLVTGHLALWHLIAVAGANAAAAAVNDVAHSVALRHVVPASQLPQAFALNEGRGHAVGLAGQPVGGLLYGIAPVLPLIADLVSFTVSAVLTATVRHRLTDLTRDGRERAQDQERILIRKDLVTGLTFLWRQPFLRATLCAAAGYQFVYAGAIFCLIAAFTAAGASATSLGLLFATAAVGGILGSVAAPAIQRRLSLKASVLIMGWLAAIAFASFSWIDNSLIVGALLGGIYFFSAPANASLLAAQIQRTPPHLQGRVIAASFLIAGLAAPLGPPIGGLLLDTSGATFTFISIAALTSIITIAIHLNRAITDPPPSEERVTGHRA